MFKALSGSDLGKQLLDYLDRMMSNVCDSRNWGEHDTKESTKRVAKVIEDGLINKIKLQNKDKSVSTNEYE